jgi:hypothetical protein
MRWKLLSMLHYPLETAQYVILPAGNCLICDITRWKLLNMLCCPLETASFPATPVNMGGITKIEPFPTYTALQF